MKLLQLTFFQRDQLKEAYETLMKQNEAKDEQIEEIKKQISVSRERKRRFNIQIMNSNMEEREYHIKENYESEIARLKEEVCNFIGFGYLF